MADSGKISVDSENIFQIIQGNIYDDKDVFIRELIANGADAIAKSRSLNIGPEPGEERIDVVINEKGHTISFSDNGIGMTRDEVERYINQVAVSGTKDFAARMEASGRDSSVIGQFGLGFYSAFMGADRVDIDTLSRLPDEESVYWEGVGSTMEYRIGRGTRTEPGTTVTLYLSDNLQFTVGDYVKKAIQRFCGYVPVPIYETVEDEYPSENHEPFGCQLVNNADPLWIRDPASITEEDYISFYHEIFEDLKDPVEQLNLYDEELGIRGIIYFRCFDNALSLKGTMKLFCRQVFVGDDVQELIPDFVNVQNGIIDMDQLPLNISRSSLKDDGYARAVYAHIVDQVGKKVEDLFLNHREKYEQIWPELGPFVKLGMLQNRRFKPFARRSLIFETLDGRFLSLEECMEPPVCSEGRIFYVSDLIQQAVYVQLFKKTDAVVLKLLHEVDAPLIRQLELENKEQRKENDREITFKRIDSDIFDILKQKDFDGDSAALEESRQTLETFFGDLIDTDSVVIRAENLIDDEVSSLIIADESTRRMQDTLELYQLADGVDLSQYNFKKQELLLNLNNILVKRILAAPDSESSRMIGQHLYDLARLTVESLDPEEMNHFVERSNQIMRLWQESQE